jgi:predicted N-acyltransferase
MAEADLTVRLCPSVGSLPAVQWDALAGPGNPFVSHAFLTALEDSASVGPGTGWTPAPLVVEDGAGHLLAALPAYAKSHSQGEYVFDHSWADAWERAGGDYYPKLQIAVPFTPATGPRLLLSDPAYAAPLLSAAERLCRANEFSSAHATFVEPGQLPLFEQAGWLPRSDIQFHWINRGYASFDQFLAALSSRKRKDLRKERAAAQDGVVIRTLTGSEIEAEHWDAFWLFYQDTGARKWGHPYLTREAFDLIGERMGDKVLLILAYESGLPIAGALNFIGGDALYGRYWGCLVDKPFLHFELCYYQAIDAAIARGILRVHDGPHAGRKLEPWNERELER